MSPRVGPSGALSRERIAAAAIALADRHGLAAVSMRQVAVRLDTGAASLYRHVANRDELVATMVEHVTARYVYPDTAGLTWRDCMHALARQDWSAFLAHPWMLTATETVTPPFGTESLAGMEWALSALAPLRLPLHEAARAVMTVNIYVQGTARVLLGDRAQEGGDDPGRNWQHRLGEVDLTGFPLLQTLVGEPLPAAGRDWLHDGLDVILAGIEARRAAH